MQVVSVTPAGRRRYLECLAPLLLRQRHVIHEHHWWLNTQNEQDRAFVQALAAQHPDFFKVCEKPIHEPLGLGKNIWQYFRDDCRPDTLYVRFDDDICYMADDAVANLVRCRLAHPQPLLVLGNIVNNAVCTHFHQQAGLVPRHWGQVQNDCMDRNGWVRGGFARRLHQLFLRDLHAGRQERWKQVAIPIDGLRRFSINVISWFGRDLHNLPELHEWMDEEPFLTEELPRRLGRPNMVCSDALFAHLAFYTQRPYLDWTWPELIDHYRALAVGQPAPSGLHEPMLKLSRDVAWRASKPARKIHAHWRKRRLAAAAA